MPFHVLHISMPDPSLTLHPACHIGLSVQVLVRARVHTVRGKGKSAFVVLRQRMATVQVGVPLRPVTFGCWVVWSG